MQPSSQGIASMFMGNPGALAARVDQDRKQSPLGIPDDLRQLMALNIVTTENDAAKRQQALQQLQQMAPNGQPPTVAENVRQQAAQKLQARMVQEQQKAQAMQQMMRGLPAAGIPQGIPQPERQPQGIDEAPVEFGMASGGIVSFQDGGSVEERYRRESEEMGEGKRLRFSPDVQEYARRLQVQREGEQADYASRERQRMLGESREIAPEQIRLAGDPNVTRETMRRVGPMTAPRFEDPRIVRNAPGITAPEAPAAPPTPPSRRAPSAGLPSAPQVAALPVAQPPAPAAPQFQDSITLQGVLNQAEAAKLRGQQDYEDRIGRPSTAALDKLMAEYERQKAATEGPKAGFAGLAEYLAQIAATPRGMSSFEAGAAGARGVQALERERAAQRAALTEKQIGLEQKRIDADRQYTKDLLGIGNAEYDRALKANLSLFEEEGKTKRQAMSDASAMTREQFRAQAELKAIEIRARFQERLQAMPSAQERLRDDAIREYQKDFPKATRFAAMMALGFAGPQGERSASPGEQLRAAEYLSQYGEPSDIESGVAVARRVAGVNQPKVMTMADVKATAKARNMTEQQVMDAAKAKGYVIQ